jgi:hypothetical protein
MSVASGARERERMHIKQMGHGEKNNEEKTVRATERDKIKSGKPGRCGTRACGYV